MRGRATGIRFPGSLGKNPPPFRGRLGCRLQKEDCNCKSIQGINIVLIKEAADPPTLHIPSQHTIPQG